MPLTRSSIVSPRHRKVIVFSLIVIIWVLGAAANGRFPLTTRSVQADNPIIYVQAAAAGNNSGDSWQNAYTSLQTALNNASSGQEIWVAAGIYKPTDTTNDRVATFGLKSGVAVYGGFAGIETARSQRDWDNNPTILSGDIDNNDTNTAGVVLDYNHIVGSNSYHVVTGSGANNTAVLDGFIITAGQADEASDKICSDGCGGGLYIRNGSPSLSNLAFTGSRARENGGGLYVWENSHPTLSNVTFSGNYGRWGGGIANWGGNLVLTNVTFSQNKAVEEGGGMTGWSSNPILTNVRFINNSVTWYGGGLYNDRDTTPILTNVVFSGNQADAGGGMYNWDYSSPTLTNVIFSGNQANTGGGMYNRDYSSPTLINVTFSGNRANETGGGMYNQNNSNPLIYNSIFWQNQDSSGVGTAAASITNWISGNSTPMPNIRYSLVQGCNPDGSWESSCGMDSGNNLPDIDPLFILAPNPAQAPTTTGNLRLQATSPAINMGNNSYIPVGVTTDLDGRPRIAQLTVDLGAYEYLTPVFLPIVIR